MTSRSGSRINPDGKKVNTELFIITYGAMVVQLLQDLKDVQLVNEQLDHIGYQVGTRLAEDLVSRTNMDRCLTPKDTADALAKSAFVVYFGVQPQISNWNEVGNEFSIVLNDNPLADFVEIPAEHKGLLFSNIMAGAIRGALETLQVQSDVNFIADKTRGDDTTEIRVRIGFFLDDLVPPADD